MYLIDTGQMDVLADGVEEPLATLGPGSFVGELGLLLGEPRSATLRATSECVLYALRREDLDALMLEHPGLGVTISRELGRRLVATNRRLVTPAVPRVVAVWGGGAGALVGALRAAGVDRLAVLVLDDADGSRSAGAVPDDVRALDVESLTPD